MKNEKKEIKYIDLFGGVGGFRLGIEQANNNWNNRRESEAERELSSKREGVKSERNNESSINEPQPTTNVKCIFYNDFDKYAVQTYNKNFKENWEATDIRIIKADSIPDFDLLCAGFPCQAFSIAGKRRGFKDTRGTLFFEIARIVKAKRPKIILLENVKGLLNHERGKTFSIILQTISELGYDVQWMVLNSKFFGVPQNRERVFIIGSLRGTSRPEILSFGEGNREVKGLVYAQKSDREIARIYNPKGIAPCLHPKTGGWQEPKIKIRKIIENKGKITEKCDGNSFTLTGSGRNVGSNQGLMNIGKIRRLTPIECERLQGFPDNWTEGVSDTQRYKQMGNAVTVNVIQAITKKLLK